MTPWSYRYFRIPYERNAQVLDVVLVAVIGCLHCSHCITYILLHEFME